MNDIKNLFDVHNPQTIPDLGLSFKLFDPYTSEKSMSTEVQMDGRMYVHTDGAQIITPNTSGWGLIRTDKERKMRKEEERIERRIKQK